MIPIFQAVRSTVTSILEDSNVGFNPTLANISSTYGTVPFVLDFSSSSTNFYQTQALPKNVLESSDTESQFMLMYGTRALQQNFEFGGLTFSGTVGLTIDMLLSFPQSDAPNSEDLSDAVADTFFNMFNSTNEAVAAMWQANGCIFGGKDSIDVSKSQVTYGSENWMQTIRVKLQVIYNA